MRMESSKCSLFGLGLSSTMKKSTRLQMSILSRLRLNSLFRRQTFPRLPRDSYRAKPMVPCRTLLHDDTSYSLISPSTQPLAGHIQNASNTLLEPRVPVVVTVPVVFTSVPQRETPGSLLAHPPSASAFGLFSSRPCACSRSHRAG